jgi:hypothetical protein
VATVPASTVALDRGRVRVTVRLDPLDLDVARAGATVLAGIRPWLADGIVRDRFVQITEGVIAAEDLGPIVRPGAVEMVEELDDGVALRGTATDERVVSIALRLPEPDAVLVEVAAEGAPLGAGVRGAASPLRIGLDWVGRPGGRVTGFGPRHAHSFDQSGRSLQLGADRRYAGEACPGELRAQGGIPHGRLRAGAVGALQRRVGGVDRDLGRGRAVRARPRAVGVGPGGGGAAARVAAARPDPGGAVAPLPPPHRHAGTAAGVGLLALEVARRAPPRRRRPRRPARLPLARHPARRDRDRLAVGDPIQHVAVQPPASSPTRRRWSRGCASRGCGRWCG